MFIKIYFVVTLSFVLLLSCSKSAPTTKVDVHSRYEAWSSSVSSTSPEVCVLLIDPERSLYYFWNTGDDSYKNYPLKGHCRIIQDKIELSFPMQTVHLVKIENKMKMDDASVAFQNVNITFDKIGTFNIRTSDLEYPLLPNEICRKIYGSKAYE